MVQLRQKVTVAGELTGTAEEIARERDELRREMEERKDEHTLVRNALPFPSCQKSVAVSMRFLPRQMLGKCSHA